MNLLKIEICFFVMSTEFEIGDTKISFMRKGFKTVNNFYHYSEVLKMSYYESYGANIVFKNQLEDFDIPLSKNEYYVFEKIFLQFMNNYYLGEKPKNEQLDRIEKKLDDLFYAPPNDNFVPPGYQEAKTDFEEKTKN